MATEDRNLVIAFAELVSVERDPSVLWPTMLEHLQQEIGFDSGYIAASWGASHEGRGAITGHDEPFMKRNLDRLLSEITLAEISRYTERASRHDAIWSPRRRREMAVFNEVLDPINVTSMLVRAGMRNGNLAGFNLERQGRGRPFSDRDLALVDAVAPFLHVVELLTLHGDDRSQTQDFAAAHGLSRRETEFFELAVRGLQNGEIALLTGVSLNTVRNTLVKVFEKSNVSNRAELAYLATRAAGKDGDGRSLTSFARKVEQAARARAGLTTSDGAIAQRPAAARHIAYTPPLAPGSTR